MTFTIVSAFFFGFFHHWNQSQLNFDRLHVFLFNLCSGGAVILYYTEGASRVSRRVALYFFTAILYAFSAFFEYYSVTLVLSVPLFFLVESIRVKRFSLFPKDFFTSVPISEKFLQASLCCLSSAIFIASLVILNNVYFKMIYLEKLTLEVFFLGYSFPVSLLTLAIIFRFIKIGDDAVLRLIGEILFWTINLGVIVFFGFILFKFAVLEIMIATVLIFAVVLLFGLFFYKGEGYQRKHVLLSGVLFLVFTAITGLLYLLKYQFFFFNRYHEFVLTFHSAVALYGWNLSGLFLAIRWKDFPLKGNHYLIIALQWLIVFILAPLGKYSPLAAMMAVPAFAMLVTTTVMFSHTDPTLDLSKA